MGLTREGYRRLRAKLRIGPALLPTLGILVADLFLLTAAGLLLQQPGLLPYLVAQPLLAMAFFHGFCVVHECGHGNLSRRPWVNTLVGHVASLLCGLPYFPWKYIHQQHHVWTGHPEQDPTLQTILRWQRQGVPTWIAWCWRNWIPVGALLQHVVYLLYPIEMWRNGTMTRSLALRSSASVLWLVASYAALAVWAPSVMRPQNVVLAIGLLWLLEEAINTPHHVGVAASHRKLLVWEQTRVTRSSDYPWWVSCLLLNFNLHIEHHLFPSMPWHRLHRLSATIRTELGTGYQQAGIGWLLAHRRRALQDVIGRAKGP